MMKITEAVKKIFHKTINNVYLKSSCLLQKGRSKSPEKQTIQDIRQRELELYGEERVNQQRLYESWVVKDSWSLMSEALPLLAGYDPGNKSLLKNDEKYRNKMIDLSRHAKQCVEQGLLPVTNPENKPEDWHIHPFNAYRWAAVSRIEMPEILTTLMEFITKTVKQPVIQDDSIIKPDDTDNYTREYDEDRERILGTALAILASYSERCRNNNGHVQTDKILEILNEKGKFWFGNHPPNLANDAIRDLIDKWVNTVP